MKNKSIVLLYFIFFIFLNIFDFFNLLPNDLDFFKKILSWLIIGYLFYSISFTKLFIGTEYKIYDRLFLFAYCLLVIPKILFTYLTQFGNETPFVFFTPVINLLQQLTSFQTLLLSLLSLILVILIATHLFFTKPILSKSFVGNINKFSYPINKTIQLFLLYFISLFFGLIIFDFFMQWFALAIDSIILVVGLIYYLFVYMKHHTNTGVSQILWNISNTGNDFYTNLLNLFSRRSTFFIAVSFLLVLHLLVDIGVYLVPYSIGTENTLYFSGLEVDNREHQPLFSLFNPTESQFGEDIKILQELNTFDAILLTLSVFLIYMIHLSAYFLLMIFPFLFYFYSLKKKTFHIPKPLLLFFLITVLFTAIFFIFFHLGQDPTGDQFKAPLQIGIAQNEFIQGVDIHTSSILAFENEQGDLGVGLLLMFIIVLSLYALLKYGCYKYYSQMKKFSSIIIIIFFITYILMFYFSTNLMSAPSFFSTHIEEDSQNTLEYQKLSKALESSRTTSNIYTNKNPFHIKSEEIIATYFLHEQNHYLYFELSSQNKPIFDTSNTIAYNKKDEISGFIFLGNRETIGERPNINTHINPALSSLIINKNTLVETLRTLFNSIHFLFISLFYLLGLFFFTRYYIKKTIFSSE